MATFLYSVTVHKAETYTKTGTEGRRETNRDTERATFLRGHRSFHSQRFETNFRIFIRSSSHFCVSLLHTPSSSETNLWRCPPLNGQVFDSLMELRFPLSSSIHSSIQSLPASKSCGSCFRDRQRCSFHASELHLFSIFSDAVFATVEEEEKMKQLQSFRRKSNQDSIFVGSVGFA